MIYRDGDLSLARLDSVRIGILGFGSQGSAQAQNLRDSGLDVLVGLRPGSANRAAAVAMGFPCEHLDVVAESCDILAILTPESSHPSLFETVINQRARPGATLVFAHGYTVVCRTAPIREDLGLSLVAPKAIGPQLRRMYESGSGAAALIAAERCDLEIAKAYAKGLGSGRAGVIVSSFREETETDLFGEQAVLCGGIPSLAQAAFETLIEAGYSPEVAYFECVSEIKLIADMMFERGIAGMVSAISDTAQFGAMTAGPTIVDAHVRSAMKRLLESIQTGEFAADWASEQRSGSQRLAKWRAHLDSHPIEQTRKRLS